MRAVYSSRSWDEVIYREELTGYANRDGLDLRPLVFDLARQRGWPIRELTRSRHSLEDIYVQVTRPAEEEEG